MLGYAANKNPYKLWDACKEEVVVYRDVLFEENTTSIRAFGDDTGCTEDGMEIDDDPPDTYTPQGNEASSAANIATKNLDWSQEVPEINNTGDETLSAVNAAPNTETEQNEISSNASTEPRRSQRTQ